MTQLGRPSIWQERTPEIVGLYKEGLSRGEIARRLGTNVPTITRMLTRAGVALEPRSGPATRSPLTDEHKQRVSEGRRGKGTGVRSPNKQPRPCEWCGMTYAPTHARQRFCSLPCRNVAMAEMNKGASRLAWETEPPLCPCGQPIPYEHRNTWHYCSQECRTQYVPRRKTDPANYITFTCENPACGKEVTRRKSYGSNPRFCSNSCAAKINQAVHHVIDRETSTVLDSGWEALLWGLCRFLKIPIERVDRAQAIEWKSGCWYAPDFLVGSTWVEVKGLEDADDPEKWIAWKAEVGSLLIIDQQELNKLRKASREIVLDRFSLTALDHQE